jgi:signal peptidase I
VHLVALGLATAIAVIAVWIFLSFRIGVILSQSMMPTLKPGDHYLINLRAFRYEAPRRQDIVVFHAEDDLLVKRIIGLPGDKVNILWGKVYVNDQPLSETYLLEEPIVENPLQVQVPEGQLFVLGDNRNNSDDSRDFGPINLDTVLGRADRILSPSSRRLSLLPAKAPTR